MFSKSNKTSRGNLRYIGYAPKSEAELAFFQAIAGNKKLTGVALFNAICLRSAELQNVAVPTLDKE